MTRTPSVIVCCRTDDPDPACSIIEPGHSLATCANCGHDVRIGPSSVAVLLEHGAQPWCIQCVAELPPDSIILVRANEKGTV